MRRKLLSILLTLCMVLTLLPMTVLANGEYSFTAPDPIEVNGVMATVTFNPPSPQAADSDVTATVTLTGTATSEAVHTINLTSSKALLNGIAQTEHVTAGQDLNTSPVEKTFDFKVPTEDVNDLTLTHTADFPPQTITDLVIEDAFAPINGEAPVTTIAGTEEYTGTIEWVDNPAAFEPDKSYTAKIILTVKDGYTFDGIAENAFFVPCAATAANDEDNGVITVTFQSPPIGYITDGNGMMAYSYVLDHWEWEWYYPDWPNQIYNFDIQGTYKGAWLKTTYGKNGYGTLYKFGDTDAVPVNATGDPVNIGNGITMQIEPQVYSNGKFLRIVYTLRNTGSEAATVSFGSHADIQIGNDDKAPITEFGDDRGFKMENKDTGAQFNFFGKGTIGVTDIDTYWFGGYDLRVANLFTQINIDNLSDVDSGMAYSWKDKTLAPGQTRTFSVLIGIGDAQSGDNVPIGVNFDSQGGSNVDTVIVDMAGDTISAPTPPTRSGYTFGGWYTEPECTNQFNFATPITATITLYAKWTQNAPPSGGGSHTPPKYPVTEEASDSQSGGQLKFSSNSAREGDTITITCTPNTGYENGIPIVLDKDGKTVKLIENSDGTFSFKMPRGGVTVETNFTKIDYFDDVNEKDWFDEAAWYCAANGLMQGTGYRQFDGNAGTNRAMLVTVLYRLAQSNDSFENIFADVESGKWYTEAIAWAAHNKIVEGYGNDKFGPNDVLTREQMVAILYRYSMFMKYDVSKLNDLNTFTDSDTISKWALDAMKWAAGNSILEGMRNDLISPESGATRAQLAAIMQRFCSNFVK